MPSASFSLHLQGVVEDSIIQAVLSYMEPKLLVSFVLECDIYGSGCIP
jgi:hypothetical protein